MLSVARCKSELDIGSQLGGQDLRDASGVDSSGRQLLQTVSAGTRAHRKRLEHVSFYQIDMHTKQRV